MKHLLHIFLLLLISVHISGCSVQRSYTTIPKKVTLKIADRTSNALSGTQVIEQIRDLSREDRELFIWEQVLKGNIPNFLRSMTRIRDTMGFKGKTYTLSYFVLPDYMALGNDDDYFICPMTPILAQKIATELDCILPTKKMVDQIWKSALVKMVPEPIPPSDEMITVSLFEQHNNLVWKQRRTALASYPLGTLISGHKKDVVISNLIHASSKPGRVVIYGWHYTSGKSIQPLYAGHAEFYADYSHGIRLIHKTVYVNGDPKLATDVLKSESLHVLLSDEGPILKTRY